MMAAGDFYKTASGLLVPRLNFARGTPKPYPQPCQRCCRDVVSCSLCDDGFGPDEFRVTLTGVVEHDIDGTPECTECVELNNSFILTHRDPPPCDWRNVTGITCDWLPIEFRQISFIDLYLVLLEGDVVLTIDVITNRSGDAQNPLWEGRFQTTFTDVESIDCLGITNLDVPFESQVLRFSYPNGPARWCDYDEATCTVTAL